MTSSKKSAVRLLGKLCRSDQRTVFGSNLQYIASDCKTDINSVTPSLVRNVMSYVDCPEDELWRVPLLMNLINIRSSEMFLDNFEDDELYNIVENICTT